MDPRKMWTISCWKWWISISILDYRRVSILGIQIIYPYSVLFSCSFPISQPRNTKWWGSAWKHRCSSVGLQLELWETAWQRVIDMSCPTLDCHYHQHLLFSWIMGVLPGANSQLLIPQVSDTSTSSSVTAPGRPLNAKMRSIITSSACRKSR